MKRSERNGPEDVVVFEGVVGYGPGGDRWGDDVLACLVTTGRVKGDRYFKSKGVRVLASRAWIYSKLTRGCRVNWPIVAYKPILDGRFVLVRFLDVPDPTTDAAAADMIWVYTRKDAEACIAME